MRVHERIMTSHNASTSGTSRVLTASLQRLKMDDLSPTPSDCEMRSVINCLYAESIAPIEIHRQLCQIYGHTWFDGQHNSCISSAGRYIIIFHHISRTSRPVIYTFSYTSKNSCPVSVNVFRLTDRRRWVLQWFESQAADFCDSGYKRLSHGMTKILIPEVNMHKNSSILPVPASINLSINWVLFL